MPTASATCLLGFASPRARFSGQVYPIIPTPMLRVCDKFVKIRLPKHGEILPSNARPIAAFTEVDCKELYS